MQQQQQYSSTLGSAGVFSDMFSRITSPSSSSPTKNQMAVSQVKSILNRSNLTLADKIHEIDLVLAYTSHRPASFLPSQASRQQQAVSIKDLDSIFVLLVGDIFGSQAVQMSKYGQGWNLAGLTRGKNYRDFYAVLAFLGSSGTLMHCIRVLMSDSNCLYEFPASRLTFRSSTALPGAQHHPLGLLRSPGEIPLEGNNFVMLSPFEYYLYHYMSLINQSSEWYQNSLVENDSLYPILFEEYLSCYLPIGGAHFRFQQQAESSFNQSQFSTTLPSKSSLLRSDVQLVGSSAGALNPRQNVGSFPNVSAETWHSYAFLDVVTKFWLQSWNEESKEQRQAPRIPSSDVVKMIRMFIKHLHFFFNSFHAAHAEVRESLRHGLFQEFFEHLFGFLSFLFDHWPLDASFRLVLEIWLSYIQPWRYRDPEQRDNETGVFQPGYWDRFIADNINFYNALFYKIMLRFFKLDLTSNKNAFMLFRVAKVFSQEGFAETLNHIIATSSLGHGGCTSPLKLNSSFLSSCYSNAVNDMEFRHIFDDDFQYLMISLVTRVAEAKFSLQQRRKQVSSSSTKSSRGKDSFLARTVAYLFLEQSEPNSELDEIDRTTKHLEFVDSRLCQIFSLSVDADALAANSPTSSADSRGTPASQIHDEMTVMTPQKRWDIVNRVSKYSPKYHGNPDETPLRSDEFHWLARRMHQLSQFINEKFAIDYHCGREGMVGTCLRQVCQPSSTFRVKVGMSNGRAAYEHVKLPARIVLRPLASYRVMFYAILLLAFAWLFGRQRVLKIVFVLFTIWVIKLVMGTLMQKMSGGRREDCEDSHM